MVICLRCHLLMITSLRFSAGETGLRSAYRTPFCFDRSSVHYVVRQQIHPGGYIS